MSPLLTTIVLWLSVNFALPVAPEPRIEMVSQAVLADLYRRDLAPERRADVTVGASARDDVEQTIAAVYDSEHKTIFLPEGWTGKTVAELSVLVHETVHHLQYAAGLKYECRQAREKLAFEAQERWLALFGSSLEKEFAIDVFTMLVRTSCAF